jgi:lipid II:glycine glycyltransferase (peptidoglycan interpeptide bridge formation enzyme)
MHPIASSATWDSALASLPNTHLLQSWDWGEFKSRYGWSAKRYLWEKNDQPIAAAQILKRSLGPFSILYAPRGPILDWHNGDMAAQVLNDLKTIARRERALFIKIDPEINLGASYQILNTHNPRNIFKIDPDFFLSNSQVQFRNTVVLDIAGSPEDLIASFKQKTRYNIRLAERKGVTIKIPPASEVPLDLLYRLYAETSVRDGFVIRHANYYREAWFGFMQAGHAQSFIAEVEEQPVAAIIVYHFGGRALYMYGMSSGQHRDKMPNHLLQWEAIQWVKAQGCTLYDFWGAPDVFDESDSMFGVWKFKEGFNGQIIRTPGALDYAPSPFLYRLYTIVLPRLLNLMRRRGHAQTRAVLND